MKPINKIVILFAFSILLFVVSIWELVQTDFFGSLTKKLLREQMRTVSGLEVDYKNIRLSLFPIGAALVDIKVEYENGNNKALLLAQEIGIYFSIFDSFKTQVTINEISPKDAFLTLSLKGNNRKESKNKDKKIKLKNLISDIKGNLETLPIFVRTVSFDHLYLVVNDLEQEFKTLKLTNGEDLYLAFETENIYHEEVKKTLTTGVDYAIGEVRLTNQLVIENLSVFHDNNNVQLSGKVFEEKEKINYQVNTKIQGYLPSLHNYLTFKEVGELKEGELYSILNVSGVESEFALSGKFAARKGETDFVNFDKVDFEVSLSKEKILIDKFKLVKGRQSLKTIEPVEFFNFERKEFLDRAKVTAKDMELNNALMYIRKSMKPLKGRISGDILFTLGKNDFHFKPIGKLGLKDLRLQFDKNPIFKIKQATLNDASFDIVGPNFSMFADLETENSKLSAYGKVSNGKIEFTAKDSVINVEDFGKIAGFNIMGKGSLDFKAYSDSKVGYLDFNLDTKDFSFEGYQGDEVSGLLRLDLMKNHLVFSKLKASYGRTEVVGDGHIDLNNSTLNITFNHELAYYRDLKNLYKPLFSNLKFAPKDIYGDYKIKGSIRGGLSLKDLRVNFKLGGSNIYALSEYIEKGELDFELKNEIIKVDNILFKKGRGRLEGLYTIGLDDLISRYDVSGYNINLQDFKNIHQLPYNLNGVANFNLKGVLGDKIQKNDLDLEIRNTRILDRLYRSKVTIKNDQKRTLANISMLNKQLVLDAEILNSKKKKSKVNVVANNLNLKNLLSALNFVDESRLEIAGAFSGSFRSDFNLYNYLNNTTELNVSKFNMKYHDVVMNYRSEFPEIVIRKGKIVKWNLFMPGKGVKLQSLGSGNLNKSFDITLDTKIKAKVLENINRVFARSTGYIYAKGEFYKKFLSEDYKLQIYSNDFAFTTQKIPFVTNGNKFYIEFKNGVFKINEFRSRLKEGYIDVSGEIDLTKLFPIVNLTFDMNNANISLLDKSNIYLTGKGGIIGKTLPYTVTGNFELDQTLIGYDLDDLGGVGSVGTKKVNFLPQAENELKESLLSLNLTMATKSPIVINNSLADIGMVGQVNVTGSEDDIKILGKLDIAGDRINKIFVNNNEFSLQKGTVFFYEDYDYTNPEIDVLAKSQIRDYEVDVKAFGHIEDLTFDLTSEPSLSQKDIFSLIAFGYTEDISSNLSTSEQESLTTAGVGSLIFDRFKINKTLKKEFGLQVNLGTEIQESERNLLEGGAAEINSATKIEVKKQISKKLDLSVSTTMGTSVEQRQNMKLNYDLNDGLSVEGIMEIRSGQLNDNQTEGTSVGADIKKQWTFK
jgi:translocation and assembly module TamB